MAWRQALVATWLVLAGCDGGGSDYVLPRVADVSDLECFTFDCAIALGADVDADAYIGTDVTEYAAISSAMIDPPWLATITTSDHAFTLHALAEGTGVLHIVTRERATIDQPIRVASRATTTVEVLGLPPAADPRGPYDVIGPHVLGVIAIHRDATGARLLGHGFEAWAATGAELTELPATTAFDGALARDVTLTAATASVTVGGGSLELASVPASSTTSVVLARDRALLPNAFSVSIGAAVGFDVLAYASDGRFIIDPGLATAVIADPSIASVEPSRYRAALGITGRALGHTTLVIHLDGAVAQYDIDVPR